MFAGPSDCRGNFNEQVCRHGYYNQRCLLSRTQERVHPTRCCHAVSETEVELPLLYAFTKREEVTNWSYHLTRLAMKPNKHSTTTSTLFHALGIISACKRELFSSAVEVDMGWASSRLLSGSFHYAATTEHKHCSTLNEKKRNFLLHDRLGICCDNLNLIIPWLDVNFLFTYFLYFFSGHFIVTDISSQQLIVRCCGGCTEQLCRFTAPVPKVCDAVWNTSSNRTQWLVSLIKP